MPIHLYIEHLLNIRTLSIQASLPTSSTSTTHATISADKSTLTLTHEDETASIKLPINLSPNKESKISLGIPPVPQKELSFRVQLEEKDGAQLTYADQDRDGSIVTPWTATHLTSETEICCKACRGILIERGKIKQWKDLPSEGWAEMMDFWHCHKPDHPEGPHSHGVVGELHKGYAAGSKLALETGVGMVDALNFVITANDCVNLKVGSHSLFALLIEPMVRISHVAAKAHSLFASLLHGPKRTGAPAPQGNIHGTAAGIQSVQEQQRKLREASFNPAHAAVDQAECMLTSIISCPALRSMGDEGIRLIRYICNIILFQLHSLRYSIHLSLGEQVLTDNSHQTGQGPKETQLLCSNTSCGSPIGSIDHETQGYKLHKPSLSLSVSPSDPTIFFDHPKWLSLQILTAVESQGVRKFTLPLPQRKKQIKLWIFTPDLLISTSALESNEPVRVSKILWKEEDAAPGQEGDLSERLSRQSLAQGELDLGEDGAERLIKVLRGSGEWLPKGAREFSGWTVGLLERFSRADLESR